MEYLPDSIFHPLAILLAPLVLMVLVYCVGMYNYWILRRMNIPGATPLPYVGNLRDFSEHGGMHLCILAYMKKYGKVFSLCTGRRASIVIADPELLKQIMVKDFHEFTNRYSSFGVDPDKRKRILLQLEDDDWKRVRSVLNPTFTASKLKLMVPLMEKSCNTLVEKLQGVADTDKSVDVLQWFSLLSLEVILSTAFGVETPVQTENTKNMFLVKVKELFKGPALLRFLLVLPFSSLVVRLIGTIGQKMKFFRNASQEILKAKRREGAHEARDMVDLMLSTKNIDGTTKLHDEEMVSQSVTFLVGGNDTTSNALTMSAYYLALNPEIQERLRSEIIDAVETNPDKPLYELVHKLEYLGCFMNEVLRLVPPIHYVNRKCSKPYKISDATTIPAGMQVVIPIYSLHHDPEAWPDPEKFDPERFRGPAQESRHPFQFMPFGKGPRNCIGKRFALLEVKITLVNILTKYKFVRCPETQVPLKFFAGVTLIPKDGVFLRVESLG